MEHHPQYANRRNTALYFLLENKGDSPLQDQFTTVGYNFEQVLQYRLTCALPFKRLPTRDISITP